MVMAFFTKLRWSVATRSITANTIPVDIAWPRAREAES